jgi:outer membrane receptor protein involved in Fe transport
MVARSLAGFWSIGGQASYIWGKNVTDDQPIRRIPPPLGKFALRWDNETGTSWAELVVIGALKQNRLSAGDIRDERIPEGGTPGWATLNVRGGLELLDWVTVMVATENVTNKRYRLHGSGIDAPGFNVVTGLTLTM